MSSGMSNQPEGKMCTQLLLLLYKSQVSPANSVLFGTILFEEGTISKGPIL